MSGENQNLPEEGRVPKIVRGALQIVSGAIPFAGGLFSAAAGRSVKIQRPDFR